MQATALALARQTPSRPNISHVEVFVVGEKDELNVSIGCYRIPALVRTSAGTLLAFAEGRVGGCKPDVAGDRPIVVRSSTDDGVSWGPIRRAVPANKSLFVNYPAPVALDDGSIMLLYKLSGSKAVPGGAVMSTRSVDDGVTWSQPERVPSLPTSCASFSPAVLRPGPRPFLTRLVAACGHFAMVSDDAGRSWRRNAGANISLGANVTRLGEPTIVADGRAGGRGLSTFVRVGSHAPLATHALAQSEDGGESWGSARLLQLRGTTCEGGVGHDPTAPPGQLLLSAPSWPDGGLGGRRNVSLFTLDGNSTASQPVSVALVWWGAGGYSSIDTTAGVRLLYEAGNNVYDWGIKMSRIAL